MCVLFNIKWTFTMLVVVSGKNDPVVDTTYCINNTKCINNNIIREAEISQGTHGWVSWIPG